MKKEKDIFREAVKRMKKEVLDAKFNEADKRNALKEAFTERPLEAGLAEQELGEHKDEEDRLEEKTSVEEYLASHKNSKTLQEVAPVALLPAVAGAGGAGTAMVPYIASGALTATLSGGPPAIIAAAGSAPALAPFVPAITAVGLSPLGWAVVVIALGLGGLAAFGWPEPEEEGGNALSDDALRAIVGGMLLKYRSSEDVKEILANADRAQLEDMFTKISLGQAKKAEREAKKKDKKKDDKKKDDKKDKKRNRTLEAYGQMAAMLSQRGYFIPENPEQRRLAINKMWDKLGVKATSYGQMMRLLKQRYKVRADDTMKNYFGTRAPQKTSAASKLDGNVGIRETKKRGE